MYHPQDDVIDVGYLVIFKFLINEIICTANTTIAEHNL